MTLTRETAYLDYKTTRGLIDRQTPGGITISPYWQVFYLRPLNSYQQQQQQHPSAVLSIFCQELQEEYNLLSDN